MTLKVSDLTQENEALKKELETKKNSKNSSLAPSKDIAAVKKNQSLRKKSGKQKGGQKGHKGSTLKMTSTPDKIINQIPCFCNKCGDNLESITALLKESRQVVDIPPIVPIYTEYRSFSKTCPCGHENKGDFPANVNAPIQYGPTVNSLIAYFSVRQYLPYQRMRECLNDIFGLQISQATLVNIVKKMARKSLCAHNKIKENIFKSIVVGSDETGIKVNGDKSWLWVWQNKLYTYITVALSRGFKVIENEFPDGLPNSVLQSDSLAAQLKTKAKVHQLCIAHLMREVQYFIDLYDDDWAKKMNELLLDSLVLKKQLVNYNQDNAERNQLESRLDDLLAFQVENQPKKIKPFHNRLAKYRTYLFPFLYYEQVSPDNNGSERAIRNAKVKMKISGMFITLGSAMDFAVLRSVIDTSIKNKANILHILRLTAKLPT